MAACESQDQRALVEVPVQLNCPSHASLSCPPPFSASLLAMLAAMRIASFQRPRPLNLCRPQSSAAGELEYDGHSDFSHIRIRRRGPIRSMIFVRDNEHEVLETQMDLRRPAELKFEYLRYLFASYLFQPEPKQVLITSASGGGSVVHYSRPTPAREDRHQLKSIRWW